MISSFNKLNQKILSQKFDSDNIPDIEHYKAIAASYAELEGSIAVLSDMKNQHSYLYYGAFAQTLGLKKQITDVDDVWEKEVMTCIHPDDLEQKFIQELRYFHFIMRQPKSKRGTFCLVHPIRMCDKNSKWYDVIHKEIYVPIGNGELWLSFCLYSPLDGSHTRSCFILEFATGNNLPLLVEDDQKILSVREKEILRCINQGLSSKEIADKLFISVNTVSRHRQNIMVKLKAKGSIEACRIAQHMELI